MNKRKYTLSPEARKRMSEGGRKGRKGGFNKPGLAKDAQKLAVKARKAKKDDTR